MLISSRHISNRSIIHLGKVGLIVSWNDIKTGLDWADELYCPCPCISFAPLIHSSVLPLLSHSSIPLFFLSWATHPFLCSSSLEPLIHSSVLPLLSHSSFPLAAGTENEGDHIVCHDMACENSNLTLGGFRPPDDPPDVRRLFSQAGHDMFSCHVFSLPPVREWEFHPFVCLT